MPICCIWGVWRKLSLVEWMCQEALAVYQYLDSTVKGIFLFSTSTSLCLSDARQTNTATPLVRGAINIQRPGPHADLMPCSALALTRWSELSFLSALPKAMRTWGAAGLLIGHHYTYHSQNLLISAYSVHNCILYFLITYLHVLHLSIRGGLIFGL